MSIRTRYGIAKIPKDMQLDPNQDFVIGMCEKTSWGDNIYYETEKEVKNVVEMRNEAAAKGNKDYKYVYFPFQMMVSDVRPYDENNRDCHFFSHPNASHPNNRINRTRKFKNEMLQKQLKGEK